MNDIAVLEESIKTLTQAKSNFLQLSEKYDISYHDTQTISKALLSSIFQIQNLIEEQKAANC